jgi:hypothetical protein
MWRLNNRLDDPGEHDIWWLSGHVRQPNLPAAPKLSKTVHSSVRQVKYRSFFRRGQAPVSMGLCAGQASTKLALLSRLGATSRATNCQDWFLLHSHRYTMHRPPATRCSIVTTAFAQMAVCRHVLSWVRIPAVDHRSPQQNVGAPRTT